MDKANAELAKLVNNLIAALKDVITSYEISAEELSLMFESLSEVLPTINEIQVALGIKLNEEEINKFIPIWYLGKSIQFLSQADIVYFGGDWRNAKPSTITDISLISLIFSMLSPQFQQ